MAVPPELQPVIETVADAILHVQNINYAQGCCFADDNHLNNVDLALEHSESALSISALSPIPFDGHGNDTWFWIFAFNGVVYKLVQCNYWNLPPHHWCIRTSWAIMGKGKKLGYFLFGWYVTMYIAAIIIGESLYLKKSAHLASPAPPLGGCIVMGATPYVTEIFAAALVYETGVSWY
ncbi:hypothetical protein NP233_g11830 [Leucocoprinus birnbaumii]|uniref:Uncharacterized protein n=1 Tax=Leucocoprinus birnbaumii TaxID=56174 RepID=A0AAD5YQK5_9AGAR|nr:hypothetical protein NP233_g11830 [Leucocoprinus birnbaumii]